jgi:hypothetical protein
MGVHPIEAQEIPEGEDMNVDDIKVESIEVPQEVFVALFDHQYKAQLQYEGIERRNGFYHPGPMRPPIDDAQLQHWMKDMFWRTTEELAEAMECLDGNPNLTLEICKHMWRDKWEDQPDLRHFFEELADAMHFLINASIYAGLNPVSINANWDNLKAHPRRDTKPSIIIECVYHITMRMGLAANCLKNKPWKLSQMPTDIAAFRTKLLRVWGPFNALWLELGCTLPEVYQLYMRKYTVNTFRRETRY